MDELTTQKQESEATEPQPQDPELTNSSTVVSPQIQNAEATEPEMASAERSENAVALESIYSDLNSDVSAENTLDSKIWESKSLDKKLKTKSSNYFLKKTTKGKRKGMKP